MQKTSIALKKSDFNTGKTLYFTLDIPSGTFKIKTDDSEEKTVAEVSGLQGKTLLPFVSLYYNSAKVSLIE